MSRSIKKHPFISICIRDSNKCDKKQANKTDSLTYYISRKEYEQLNDYYNKLLRK